MKNITSSIPIRFVLIAILTGFIALQFFSNPLEQKQVTGHLNQVPQPIEQILERSCFNCHSNEQQLSILEKTAPISWWVNKDIVRAREVLNFSEWDKLSVAEQEGKFYAILNMVKAGKMPLPAYALTHPGSKLSSDEVEMLKTYTLSLSSKNQTVPTVKEVPLSPNGVAYNAEFKDWQVIGISSFFDNSIRIIYGNPIAVKAIEEENFHPWPNGSTVAKAVFKQVKKANGAIVPGEFINVQYMVKNGTAYTDTEGWGFAKFSGPDLKPTGKTALFAKQSCIGCHRQLAGETGFLFDVPPKVNSKKLIEQHLETK